MKWMFGRTAQWIWLTFATAAVAFAAGQAPLPEGAGKPLVEYSCTGCHNLERVTNKKWDKETWQAVVERMREKENNKADISDENLPVIVDYLTANFGTGAAPAAGGGAAADAQMAELVKTACTTCHSMDLVSGYKGSKDDWDTMVKNMVAYGAQMKDNEIPLLVEYLAKTYPK